ncbi:MAG: N-acetylmuramidase domain-containing protein, partial [Rubrivivax sp.]
EHPWAPSDPYVVRRGDTLSDLAKRSGRSVKDLQRLNGIENPNVLAVGQTLYLSEATAFGVRALFLDALRHPISNLNYRLRFDGREVLGRTADDGLTLHQVTQSAATQVEVWIQEVSGLWRRLARAASGFGDRLLTLVSPFVVVPGQTHLLPERAQPLPSPVPEGTKERQSKPAIGALEKPKLPPTAQGTPVKNNPALKTRSTRGAEGQSVIKLEVDLPQDLLQHFTKYEGGEITEADWKAAAGRVPCNPNVLKAISEVETGGRSPFWRLNDGQGHFVPAILYERHYFSRLTQGAHDGTRPDISWKSPYRQGKQLGSSDAKMHDGRVDADDVYSSFASSYLRLINAFRLAPEAALRSCSWGKFQIMGDNFALCELQSVKQLVDIVSTSEAAQLKLLAGFIRRKPAAWIDRRNKSSGKHMRLRDAVRQLDWRMIAFNYNGPAYEKYSYHTKLQKAYEKHQALVPY